jgi:hypothetical protein
VPPHRTLLEANALLKQLTVPELVADQAASFIELSSCEEPPSITPWDVELQLGAEIILRLRYQC